MKDENANGMQTNDAVENVDVSSATESYAEQNGNTTKKKRGSFTGKIGFVLAAAGSAVGLGNIWRFPYLAAKYGGGIFLLTYIVLAVTFGFVLMIAEIALGRKTGSSAINAFSKLNKKWAFLGVLCAIIPIIILPYYSVIGGWVGKYFTTYITGQGMAAANEGYFNSFISSPWQPLVFFAVFVTIAFLVVLFGVEKGVEKVSKILMPALVLLTIGVTIYTLTMPGTAEGIKYYLLPDFKKFSVKTVLAALGQLFYSMSLAMGIMITYGSYMKKQVKIESSVHQIEVFDTGIAILSGLMIIPAAYTFSGGNPETLGQGPGLMFLGIPSALGFGVLGKLSIKGMTILDMFDFLSNSVLMPIAALLTCIFIGYIIGCRQITEEIELNGRFKFKKFFNVMIKYICPICIVAILVTSILSAFGVFNI